MPLVKSKPKNRHRKDVVIACLKCKRKRRAAIVGGEPTRVRCPGCKEMLVVSPVAHYPSGRVLVALEEREPWGPEADPYGDDWNDETD